jgi:Phage late-transcription coactivator
MSEQPEGVYTKKSFSDLIEKRVRDDRSSYLDAIIDVCKERMTDPEDVVKLLSNPIKAKLEAEGMNLGYLKRTNELPFE